MTVGGFPEVQRSFPSNCSRWPRIVANQPSPESTHALFRAPVLGTRQGKTVLVQLRDAIDPETGRYTVKRYESEKTDSGDEWQHAKVTLKPNNPEFTPIVLTDLDKDAVQVVAELLAVI